MTISIIGAGLSGLLVGNMLRHCDPIVHEVQASLPNNHSAILRFRSPSVGDVLNIPFKKVTMIKTHLPWHNQVADALAYSFKTNGTFRSDRSITSGLVAADRWIAPLDLITRMAERLDIRYGQPFEFGDSGHQGPIISTLPMPALMKELGYKSPLQFNSTPGLNVKATIADCDAYVSLLIPDPTIPFSRVSITGNELITECHAAFCDSVGESKLHADLVVSMVSDLLGIHIDKFSDIRSYLQKYAKITPVDDDARKAFLHWATVNHGIYSVGRFACWRPSLLLDDIISDVRKIEGWLNKSSKYDVARDR